MSKEKKLLPLVCTRGLSYRASRTASSVGNDAPTEKVVPTKRVCLGGRGREWAAESLRLLETMSNLEDAKLFLEPMNPLKYPEYYNLIHDPIDLSKIMLKFHGGAYPGLIHFSEDMDSMFDNYKQFFKDTSTETYHQVRRLSKWFDAELDQIKCRWYRIYDNGTKLTSSGGSGAVNPRSGSLDARIQAIKASNRRTVNLATKTESLPLQLAMNAIRLPRPLSTLSLKNASHSNASVNRTPVLAFRLASDSKSANSSKLSSSANSQSIILVSKSSADVNRTSSSDSGLMYVCGDWSKQSNHKLSAVPGSDGLGRGGGGGGGGSLLRQVPDVSQVSSGGADGQKRSSDAALKLDVGNIWFGTARNSMSHPVTVTEDGFHFLLKNADSDVSFTIQRDEIVKCAAYFGNIRKHTLFLFVLPNCVRRLAFLGEEFTLSSLIIMFPPALSQSEIAQLVYLFWRMSRLSMFGELFCEIDQKSAVALLGNIKPTIISNIAEKYKDALGNNTDAPLGVNRFPAEQRSLSNACRRNVNNGTSLNSVTTADDGALLLSDSVDAFSEVDCKIEPPDDDVEPVHEIVDSDLERLGLSSIVDAKCLTVNEKLLSDEAVDNSHDGTKSDVIRKRLKIRYRPGILKHSKRRKVEEVAQKNVSKEMEDKSPLVEEEEEDGDKEFTIIEWFPEDENQTAEDEEESVSDSSVNNGSQSLGRSKDENDLEIVAPSNNSDTELDLDVNYEALPAEDEGVVMTGEKINIRCPITQQIMKYPMKNIHCNHCYDRQGIEDLIKHRGDKAKCPVTGCSNRISLCTKDVKHDDQLSFYIQQKLNQADSK